MADDGDVVDHVEIGAPLDVEEMLLPAPLDLRRLAVIVLLRPREMAPAPIEERRGLR
jgi:hypothetical protein